MSQDPGFANSVILEVGPRILEAYRRTKAGRRLLSGARPEQQRGAGHHTQMGFAYMRGPTIVRRSTASTDEFPASDRSIAT